MDVLGFHLASTRASNVVGNLRQGAPVVTSDLEPWTSRSARDPARNHREKAVV